MRPVSRRSLSSDRLHAGPWIDGTVQPAPNQRANIHATVRELQRAPRLARMPPMVITAGILQGRWLKSVPGSRLGPRCGWPAGRRTPSTSRTAGSVTSSRRWTGRSSSSRPRPCCRPRPAVMPSPHAYGISARSRPPNACAACTWPISGHDRGQAATLRTTAPVPPIRKPAGHPPSSQARSGQYARTSSMSGRLLARRSPVARRSTRSARLS
jgi:hypothetical protein